MNLPKISKSLLIKIVVVVAIITIAVIIYKRIKSNSDATTGPSAVQKYNLDENKILKIGVKGEEVKQLQRELNKLGFSLSTDGVFGPKTESALNDKTGWKSITLKAFYKMLPSIP